MPTTPRTRTRTRATVAAINVAAAAVTLNPSPAPEAHAFVVTPPPVTRCQHGVDAYSPEWTSNVSAHAAGMVFHNPDAEYRSAVTPSGGRLGSAVPAGLLQVDASNWQRNACYRCQDSYASHFRAMRDYGLSPMMVAEETRVGRPFTYQEFVNVVAFYATHGYTTQDFTGQLSARPGLSLLAYIAERTAYQRAAAEQRERDERERQRAYERNVARQRNSEEAVSRVRNGQRAAAVGATDVARFALSAVPADVPENGPRVAVPSCECDPDEDCNCGNRDAAYEARRHPTWLRKSPKHGTPFLARKCDRNKRLVGVELEFNTETDLTPWVQKWHGAVHTDGSCGWEGVTTPLAGGHIELCLKDLTRSLRRAGATADERCGVHVHVDSRDVRWADMLRLLKVYAKVEPLLYLVAGQHRIQQNYCKPCGPMFSRAIAEKDPKDAVMAFAFRDNMLSGGRAVMKDRPGKKDGGRYKGLNIIPWLVARRNGAPDCTVEFRMHRNSLNGERVAGWAQLCAALVEYACRATDAEVNALPKSALRILAEHVSPEQRSWLIRRVLDWRKATTAERNLRSDENGERMATRRIKVKGGVFSCAV